jgi:membrane AbrB-like protein
VPLPRPTLPRADPLGPRLARALLTLLIAAGGGAAASLMGVPLAWMIGAMLAVAAAGFARFPAEAPGMVRITGLVVLGTALGLAFTAPVLRAVAASMPAIVLGGLAAIGAGAAVGRLTARLAGTDARTGYFCSVPGGIIVMVVLAARAGADVAAVTLSQTLRMALVVLVYPPLLALSGARGDALFAAAMPEVDLLLLPVLLAAALAGALALRLTGAANPWMLGPVAVALGCSVAGIVPSGVPAWLSNAAQVLMGASLGVRLTPGSLLRSRRLAVASVVSVVAIALLLAAFALLLAWGFGLPAASVVLGMAPGGMPEMAVTAKVLNLGVPLVLAFHLVRTLLCNILVGPLWRLMERLGPA